MDSAGYVSLTRQAGLMSEMRVIANNLANMTTNGYKAERLVYSEFIGDRGTQGASISSGHGNVRASDFSQGSVFQSGATLDLAIEGEGFFRVATPDGDRLTRAGAFGLSADGLLVDARGNAVLDEGGAPIPLPANGGLIEVGADGTISVGGQILSKIGIWSDGEDRALERRDGVGFLPPAIAQPVEATVLQGFIERSNVDPVSQIARMIEVQRAYELGQSILDREDERIRNTVRDVSK